jgi:hypothetical protein
VDLCVRPDFVGVDARDTDPSGCFSCDRNLAAGGIGLKPGLFVLSTNTPLVWTKAIHGSCGYVGLADGSVQFFDQPQLVAAVRTQSADTNRLAIP